jgi:hypothetical protein
MAKIIRGRGITLCVVESEDADISIQYSRNKLPNLISPYALSGSPLHS